ncbi:MAG: hypothetical protein KA792_04470 [Bacteroidales bacterium]|nr:hypothetical protein [Bacteroidales bacterium]
MNKDILFFETQKFRQLWLLFLLLSVVGITFMAFFIQFAGAKQQIENPIDKAGLLISACLIVLITLLFYYVRLETQIRRDGIYVRFFPFHIKYKFYNWESLSKVYIRQYSAIKEYGGWGLRIGFFRKGKALNVSGNKGLQLEFTNKKRLLIGTNKPDELTSILSNLGQLKQ